MHLKQYRFYAILAIGVVAFATLALAGSSYFLSRRNPSESFILQPSINPPIEVSIDRAPLRVPAGPAVNITVTNIATRPISLLEINLKSLGAMSSDRIVWFNEVNLTNPLLPGQSAWKVSILIEGGYNVGLSYSIPVEGQFIGGEWFQFAAMVRVNR